MANQGIIHLAFKVGARPYCNSRLAIMSTTEDQACRWPKICKKCEATRLKYQAKRDKKLGA